MKLKTLLSFPLQKTPAAFCARAVVLLLAFGLSSLSGPFDSLITNPLILLSAWLTHVCVSALGTATQLSGRFVYSSGPSGRSPSFSIEVIPECTGVFAFIILLSLILAYPARWGWKAAGLISGALLILLLNQVRLVTLFLLGIKAPELFEETHVFVWQGIFILVIAFFWYAWVRRTLPGPGAAEARP
jgi:exosortase H (IPTLxxWG-CTERM-specific)